MIKLDKPLNFYQKVLTQDAAGQPLSTYVLIYATGGNIKSLNGGESFKGQQIVSEVTHRITIRYTARIKAHHIIRCCPKQFEIMAVINVDEDNKWLQLECKEVGRY